MKVNEPISDKPDYSQPESGFSKKAVSQLSAGERFMANIVDIKPGQVTIQTEDGALVTARSNIAPDAHIGDKMAFLVTANKDGVIALEMLKETVAAGNMKFLLDLLKGADLYPTEENIRLLQSLMEENLPVDQKTLLRAAFFYYSDPAHSLEGALFLTKEGFPANAETMAAFQGNMAGSWQLSEMFGQLDNLLAQMDSNERLAFLSAFYGTGKDTIRFILDNQSQLVDTFEKMQQAEDKNLKHLFAGLPNGDLMYEAVKNDKQGLQLLTDQLSGKKVSDSLAFQMAQRSLKELPQFYRELYTKIDSVLYNTENTDIGNPAKECLNQIKSQLLFMNQIHEDKYYLQIPLALGSQKRQGELHIFRDKSNKKQQEGHSSALLALDLAYLGHVEVYLQRAYNDITLNFQTEEKSVESLFKQHLSKLTEILQEKGYHIQKVSFETLTQKSLVTKKLDEKTQQQESKRRYSFDIRV